MYLYIDIYMIVILMWERDNFKISCTGLLVQFRHVPFGHEVRVNSIEFKYTFRNL
jgi:hypothetical protein